MPAIRTDATVLHLDIEFSNASEPNLHHEVARGELSLRKRAAARPTPSPSTFAPPAKPAKKKKAPNAFILFRSHAIANKLLPKSVTHQNDVSRMVAELWRAQDSETREHFFKLADEEKVRFQMESGGDVSEVKKRRPRTRMDRPASRKVKRAVVQVPTPPASPEARVPASPALSIASSTSDWSNASLQYSMPKSGETCLLSPPSEHSLSIPCTEHTECTDLEYSFAEPCDLSLEFEWSAMSPTSSLSLISSSADDSALGLDFGTSSLIALDFFNPLPTVVFPDFSGIFTTS